MPSMSDDAFFAIFFAVCALAMLGAIFAWVRSLTARHRTARQAQRAKGEEDRRAAEAADWARIERDFALSCTSRVGDLQCAGLAVPIRGTKNRYRCPVCSFQFAGEPHGL